MDDESVVAYVVALAGDGLGVRTIRNYIVVKVRDCVKCVPLCSE